MVHAKDGDYTEVELFDKPALFSNYRIDRDTVPEGLYCYDLRGSDYDPGSPVTVEPYVTVNHAGSVLTIEPIEFSGMGESRRVDGEDGLNLTGGDIELEEFCAQHDVEYPKNQYDEQPASESEAGIIYAQGMQMGGM